MRHHATLRRVYACAILLSALLGPTTPAGHADPPVPRETTIFPPGRSIASNDQSSALATNPANLGFLRSTELRWTWVRTGGASPVSGRGHSFDLAFALPANV